MKVLRLEHFRMLYRFLAFHYIFQLSWEESRKLQLLRYYFLYVQNKYCYVYISTLAIKQKYINKIKMDELFVMRVLHYDKKHENDRKNIK